MTRQDKIEKKAKVIKTALRVTFLCSILVVGYGGSMIYSVLQMDVVYEEITGVYDNNGTTGIYSDDSYTIVIPVINEGFYAYSSFTANFQVIAPDCPGLNPDTIVGLGTKTFAGLSPGGSTDFDVLIDITTNVTILNALIASNYTVFEFSFSFEAFVHIFTIFFSGTLPLSI